MSLCLSLRLPILMCVGVLLTGAVNPQPAHPSRPVAAGPAIPLTEDAAATALVDDAIRALDPQRVPWLHVQLWQRVQLPRLVYQSEGLYQSGPGHRLRLDLTVRVRDTEGQVHMVCDGSTFWQSGQVGGGPGSAFKIELRELAGALGSAGQEAQFLEDFLRAQSFAGPLPLLHSLRKDMRFTRRDLVRCRGKRMIRLIGVAIRPAAAGQAGPAASLRQCRLYLDEQTLWPCRLEWWGPAPQGAGDAVLMQMEFRNPQRPHVLPEQAFRFDASTAQVRDCTLEWADFFKSHCNSLVETPYRIP